MPLETSSLVTLSSVDESERREYIGRKCLVERWVPAHWVVFDYHPTRHFASLYNPEHGLYREIPKSRLRQILLTDEVYDWSGDTNDPETITSLPQDLDWDWEEIDRVRKETWGSS